MKKNQAQKFIVLFLFFLFAYSWRVEAQTGKEKQITMEFKNEGLPSIFKRFEKVSGYKVLFIYDEISSYTSTGKVEKATVDEALKVIIGKNPLKYHIDGQFINITKEDSKKFFSQVKGKVFSEEYNPQIQISAESETKRSIFREKDKTKRSKKESAQHSKSRNKSFVMTSVSAL